MPLFQPPPPLHTHKKEKMKKETILRRNELSVSRNLGSLTPYTWPPKVTQTPASMIVAMAHNPLRSMQVRHDFSAFALTASPGM